ncbi:MAG TPA: hypothetical protein VH328_08605 [Burkholderiaceae bacterium]|nr:hypothetical protein [Burkholderiaceae bacterium]
MELHLHSTSHPSHHWQRRAPDWIAAAVAGFAAGALVMVVEMLWSAFVQGASPWTLPRMVAAIGLGPASLGSDSGFNAPVLGTALAIHYALGIVFALVLAVIIAPFRLDSSVGLALLVGAVFGVALYLFDFYGMARAFTWFEQVRGGGMLMLHVIYGLAAAALYCKLERREREGVA